MFRSDLLPARLKSEFALSIRRDRRGVLIQYGGSGHQILVVPAYMNYSLKTLKGVIPGVILGSIGRLFRGILVVKAMAHTGDLVHHQRSRQVLGRSFLRISFCPKGSHFKHWKLHESS